MTLPTPPREDVNTRPVGIIVFKIVVAWLGGESLRIHHHTQLPCVGY